MTPYPDTMPMDAVSVVLNAARNGLAPSGQHGDLNCLILAGWNLEGFALKLGFPHDHMVMTPDAEHTKSRLVELLAPAEKKGAEGGGFDPAGMPWPEIITLVVYLISLFKKKPA